MNILETFYLLFKTDAAQAADDVKKVGPASDTAADGLEKVDAAANRSAAAFVSLAKKAAAFAGIGLSLGATLSAITGRMGEIRELDQFSSKLNSSIEDVDAFRRTVVGMGGETAGALDSLSKVAEKVNEAFSDAESGARKDLQSWGIAFKDAEGKAIGASDAMLNLASSLEGVSRAEALDRLKKIGIEDAATIDLLLRGRAAVEAKMRAEKEMGVVTEANAEETRKYYAEMNRALGTLQSMGNTIIDVVVPYMAMAAGAFADVTQWVRENQTLVEGFFIGIAGVITAWYLPAMVRAAIATTIATWPFLLIAGAIAATGVAIALLYEDIAAWVNGAPSLLGTFFSWLGGELSDMVEGFKRSAIAIKDAFVDAFKWLWDVSEEFRNEVLGDLSSMVDGFKESAQGIKDAIGGAFAWIKEQWDRFVAPIFDKIGFVAEKMGIMKAEVTQNESQPWQGGALPTASPDADAIRAYLNGTTAPTGVAAGQSALSTAQGVTLNGTTPSMIGGARSTTNNNTVEVGNVTVQTQATDADGIAREVDSALRRQLQNTAAQFDDGVVN